MEEAIISSFMVLNIDGGQRVSFTYSLINKETGELVSDNIKKSFYVVDPDLKEHIVAVSNYLLSKA